MFTYIFWSFAFEDPMTCIAVERFYDMLGIGPFAIKPRYGWDIETDTNWIDIDNPEHIFHNDSSIEDLEKEVKKYLKL